MNFNTLFSVNLRHEYFLKDSGSVFYFNPTSECAGIMKRHLLSFLETTGGFKLIYGCEDENREKPKRAIDEKCCLDFLIHCKDPNIQTYSDLASRNDLKKIFYFSNRGEEKKIDNGFPGLFTEEDEEQGITAKPEDIGNILPGLNPVYKDKLFGILRLEISKDVGKKYSFVDEKQTGDKKNIYPVRRCDYKLLIKAGKFLWRYFVTAKYGNNIDQLDIQIQNKNLKKDIGGFTKKKISDSVLCFTSNAPLVMSEVGYKDIVLVRNEDIPVIPNLPNPDGKSIGTDGDGSICLDTYVYI